MSQIMTIKAIHVSPYINFQTRTIAATLGKMIVNVRKRIWELLSWRRIYDLMNIFERIES